MRGTVFVAFLGLVAFPSPARAELRVAMHDGLVTVNASDVTVRQILAEWARIGQTKIVNAEGVPGGPVTLQIVDMPEEQALDILLRSVAGYLAAPRAVPLATASHFDRIVITPTSSPSSTPIAVPRPAPQPAQQLLQQVQQVRPNFPDPDDTVGSSAFPLPQQTPSGSAVNTFPPVAGPPTAQPAPQTPTFAPSAPGGLALPGTVIPATPAAGQANQPGQTIPLLPGVQR